MVNTAHYNQKLPYGLLVIFRRISAAILVVLSLRICMWFYGIQPREAYDALMIIAALILN